MTIAVPSEVIASAIVVEYWKAPVNKAVWVTLFIVLGCAINFFGVRWYGEHAAFSHSPDGIRVRRITYSRQNRISLHGIPGPIGRFLAFWTVFLQASFSYMGTEMVAITAGEAANPRKTVPKAIERVFYRILVFYLGSTLTVGLLVPSTSPDLLGGTGDASSSPFVIAIKAAGITVLPDLINVVILVSAISAASSKLYGGSRVLFGLSKDGMAPQVFSKCNSSGLPIWSLMATCSAAALSYMCLNNKASLAFQWFQNISAMTGILTWWAVLVSYLFFYQGLKVQGYDRNRLHYKAPFQPYASWIGVTMLTIIMLMSGFETFLKGGWKIAKRSKFVSPKHMDFVTGTRELDEMDALEREKAFVPTTKWEKFLDWLM
ncbi:hypothetical protein VP01_1129g8 [Puccinia sorghi]|uniref:Amino acid permease/ SLC12A domain-containing protein n=1 Tax=Puccinia sorghi TaxID=27349 RepID=A0A0L6VS72_9BASI|nr:hypothetical protein VP01_1129g8 [Puccinia sorghi]